MTEALTIARLKRRADFLRAAKAKSCAKGAVVVQRCDRADGDATVRVGFTVTRKVGNAVIRNRAKRRLREAARALLPTHGSAGADYVLIARTGTPDRPWLRLLDDVRSALITLSPPRDPPAPGAPPAPAPDPQGP